MAKKSTPTIITPEIQTQIDKWKKFAEENHIRLGDRPNIPFFADAVVKRVCCPCFGMARPTCPCAEVLDDIAKDGHCHCLVFFSQTEAANVVIIL